MALPEPLYRVSEICAAAGVENVVICPGSRSAALTLAFARNGKFRTHVITDERSAAFVALGMAQAGGKTTVLICTSGTAALNFGPAVAEAFFQGTSLLILTADRPPEWIHQYDGQTIYQQNIYGKHVVKAYDLPADYGHPDAVWSIERQVHEALAFARRGPVHINVPVREPFYPGPDEVYDGGFRALTYLEGAPVLGEEAWTGLMKTWNKAGRILIAVGQNHDNLDALTDVVVKDPRVSILADVISNVETNGRISTHDLFLGRATNNLVPDLLITLGRSFISKPFKQFFRKNKPGAHWHVEDRVELADPLQSVTTRIKVGGSYFVQELARRSAGDKTEGVKTHWQKMETRAGDYLREFLKTCGFGELKAMAMLFSRLLPGDVLHLGNSMPVRYANLLGSLLPRGVTVFSNRGTSGIEGVVSTAVGQALSSNGQVHCVVGDVSFFYDSNALFAARPQNLTVYLMQNGGGNIFRMIDGPAQQPELEKYFLTHQGRSAEGICRETSLHYTRINSEETLREAFSTRDADSTLFEIYTDGVRDAKIFQALKAGFSL